MLDSQHLNKCKIPRLTDKQTLRFVECCIALYGPMSHIWSYRKGRGNREHLEYGEFGKIRKISKYVWTCMNEENIERDKILKVGETGNWEYMKNRENREIRIKKGRRKVGIAENWEI